MRFAVADAVRGCGYVSVVAVVAVGSSDAAVGCVFGVDDAFPGVFGEDDAVGVLPFALEFAAVEEPVEEDGEAGDFAVGLVGDADVVVGVLVDVERHLLAPDDDEERVGLVGGSDVVLDVLDAFAVHREVNDGAFERPDERLRGVGLFDLEGPTEARGDVRDGLDGLVGVRREHHAVGAECARGQADVRGHPVVAAGSMPEPADDDLGFSLHTSEFATRA